MKHDLITIIIVVSVSWAGGLVTNQFRDRPLPMTYQTREERLTGSVEKIIQASGNESSTASAEFPAIVTMEMVQKAFGSSKIMTIDARPEIFYRFGHIPGSLSLPREDFETAYPKLQKKLADVAIIVYCSGSSCEDSHMVKDALARLGHKRVSVYSGGWAEWSGARLPEEKSE